MDDDTRKTELARRAEASKRWRWMSGMRDLESGSLLADAYRGDPWRWVVDGGDAVVDHEGDEALPDLDDPATLGCVVFELLPEIYDDPWLSIVADADGTFRMVGARGYDALHGYATRQELAVAALEAAP